MRTIRLLLFLFAITPAFAQCGAEWTLIARYPDSPPYPVTCVVPTPGESGSLICGTSWLWNDPASGGIYRFQNQPFYWTYVDLAGETVREIEYFRNKTNSIFAVTDQGLYVSDRLAETWDLVFSGGAEQLQDFVISPDDSTLWILVKNYLGPGTILISRNSGETWHSFYEGYPRANIAFSNNNSANFYYPEGYSLQRGNLIDSTFVSVLTLPGETILEITNHSIEPFIYAVTPRRLIRFNETTNDTLSIEFPDSINGTYGLLYKDGIGLLVSSSFALYVISDDLRLWSIANDSVPTGGYAWWMHYDDTLSIAAFGEYDGLFCRSSSNAIETQRSKPAPNMISVFPNPFNATTQIAFEVPRAERVSVKVYNLAGQFVQTLVDERMTPGVHVIPFDGSNLSSGAYFYRLTAPEYCFTQKMVLVK